MRNPLTTLGQQTLVLTRRLDRRSETGIARIRGNRSVRTVRQLARAGDGGAVWILLLLVLGRSRPREAVQAVGALALGAILVNGPLKRSVDRERPELLDGIPCQPGGSSFPSGHAFTSWLTVGMLPSNAALQAGAVTGAGLISTSRVYLRYHHLSDVLVGSLLGWATGRLVRRFLSW